MRQIRLNLSGFDAEAYWRDKKFKKWVVHLSVRSGKKKEERQIVNVQARTEERAIECAKRHSLLKGRVYGRAWLATPADLGCTTMMRGMDDVVHDSR